MRAFEELELDVALNTKCNTKFDPIKENYKGLIVALKTLCEMENVEDILKKDIKEKKERFES